MQAALRTNGCAGCSRSQRLVTLPCSYAQQCHPGRGAAGLFAAAAQTPAAAGGPVAADDASEGIIAAAIHSSSNTRKRSRRQRATEAEQSDGSEASPAQHAQQLTPKQQQQQSLLDVQQQPMAQQPRVVLTPLSNPRSAVGSIVRSSALGSWSTMDIGTPPQQSSKQQTWQLPPQQQQRQQRPQPQGRQRGSEQLWENSKQRHITAYLSKAPKLNDLLGRLAKCSTSPAFNIIHIATAYKACLHLSRKPLVQQQQQQQQQQQASDVPAAAAPPEQVLEKTLQLLVQLTATQLSAPAAPGGSSSSMGPSSGPGSSSSSLGSAEQARALAGITYNCARLQHKLPWDVLLLLLEAFLAATHEQQQQLRLMPATHNDDLQDCEQQQQQEEEASGSSWPLGSSIAVSSSSSSSKSDQQCACHALSLLCWGLSKSDFTCSSVYQLSSSGLGEQQQERLALQQLYWARLAAVGARVVAGGTPRDVSTLCYAFAAGGYEDAVLWGRLGAAVVPCMSSFTPQEFAQTLWAFATVNVAFKPLLTEACTVAPQLAPGMTPQGLGNVVWAMSMLIGYVPPTVLDATQDACLNKDLARFGSVNLVLVVGALARQGSMRVELGVAINRAVERTLPSFSGENLCKVLSGLAVLNCLQRPLMQAVEPLLLKMLRFGTVDVQQACHGVWGYAITDPSFAVELVPALLQLVSKHVHILTRSSDATAKLCSILLLTRHRDDAFVNRLAQFLLSGSTDAMPGAAAAAAAAAAAGGGGGDGRPMHALGAGSPMSHWDRQATPQHIVIIASMLAKLGLLQHTTLLQALIQRFLNFAAAPASKPSPAAAAATAAPRRGSRVAGAGDAAGSFRRSQAVLLLWCTAVLDMRQPTQLLQKLLQQLHGASELPTHALAQLVQVHMWLETLGPAGQPLIKLIPRPLLNSATTMWRNQLVPMVVHSQLHSQVLTQLSAMQVPFASEGVTPDGMFSVDVTVRYRGTTVALEVLGPDHYTSNRVAISAGTDVVQRQQQQQQQKLDAFLQQRQQQHVLLGPELLRFRLLAARNFALAAISSFEAAGAVSTLAGAQALRQLLKQKLEEAVLLHQQYKKANAELFHDGNSSSSSSSAGGGSQQAAAGGKGTVSRSGEQQRQRQQQGLEGQLDPALSRLMHQPGFTEQQQRVRRSRTEQRQQRQQYREGLAAAGNKQQAMQTLLTAAAVRKGRKKAEPAAAAAVVEGSGGDADAAEALSSVEDQFERVVFDAEFDLPLDLEDLAGPQAK